MPKTLNKPTLPATPYRVSLQTASILLSVSTKTIRRLLENDLFTVSRDTPATQRKRGGAIYLLTDELSIYCEKGAVALREYRVRKGRI